MMTEAINSSISTNTLYFNNQGYKVDLTLVNSDGLIFPINTASLVNLQIVDDGLLWYKTGTLIVRNPDNIIERRASSEVPVDANYVFRNDGRDMLIVKIVPVIDDQEPASELSPQDFHLEFVFAIYDKKDISTGRTAKDRLLQLFFWELDYQIFYETNIDWTTNLLLPSNLQPSLISDEERKVPTGSAIKNLIQYVLGVDAKFTTNWDNGSSKIFYNSLANNNAIDDLNYLLHRHTGAKTSTQQSGDPCILSRDRYTKAWSLQTLENIFSYAMSQRRQAGPLHKENFVIAGSTGSNDTSVPSLPQAPNSSRGIIYTSKINSIINNFEFEDLSPLTNSDILVNYPCYSNNLKDKTFVLDFTDNTAENVKKYIQENYINKFSPLAAPALTLNNTKKNAYIIKQAYSYQRDKVARYADSRNLLLKSFLFLNQALVFTVPGTTFRKSNVFIGVDRNQSTIINNFDYKLLGQWFTSKVVHSFTETDYSNTIYAVKIHTDDKLPISDNVG